MPNKKNYQYSTATTTVTEFTNNSTFVNTFSAFKIATFQK